MVSWHGRWYVVGHDTDRDATRVFRLSRIVGPVEFAGPAGSIEIPENVDYAAQVSALEPRPMNEVAVLRVRPDSALPLRRRANAVQRYDDEWDVIELPFADAEQLAAELSGYAADVHAIEPAELSAALMRRLNAVLTAGTAS